MISQDNIRQQESLLLNRPIQCTYNVSRWHGFVQSNPDGETREVQRQPDDDSNTTTDIK